MSDFSRSDQQLQQFLAVLADGKLSDEQFIELDRLISESTDAREEYRQYMELHAALQFEFRPQAEPAAISEIASECDDSVALELLSSVDGGRHGLSPRVKSRWASWSSVVVAALLLISIVQGWLLFRKDQEIEVAKSSLAATVNPVAFLTSANGCAWGGARSQLQTVSAEVQLGEEIVLHEGVAEFRLSSGVVLSVEGPTALVMTSPKSIVMQHGRITTYVPWSVSDFRLVAAACQLTACDSEFGVFATGGEVDIHAFSGKVLAIPSLVGAGEPLGSVIEAEKDLPPDADFSQVLIRSGRGLALVDKGTRVRVSRWHAAVEAEFATKLLVSGQLPVGRAYVSQVLQSRPVEYWRFETLSGGVALNELPGGTNLDVVGNLQLRGDARNRVVEFGYPGMDGFLVSKTPISLPKTSEYSVEAWIKPNHAHNGGLVSFQLDLADVEHADRTAFYLELMGPLGRRNQNPRSLRFLHRDPPGTNAITGTNCYSSIPYSVRRWQHIAAVKSKSHMQLYIDGNVVDTQIDSTSLAPHTHVVIGRLSAVRGVMCFVGQLDEVAIYDRALTSGEIVNHAESMNWKPQGGLSTQPNEI